MTKAVMPPPTERGLKTGRRVNPDIEPRCSQGSLTWGQSRAPYHLKRTSTGRRRGSLRIFSIWPVLSSSRRFSSSHSSHASGLIWSGRWGGTFQSGNSKSRSAGFMVRYAGLAAWLPFPAGRIACRARRVRFRRERPGWRGGVWRCRRGLRLRVPGCCGWRAVSMR